MGGTFDNVDQGAVVWGEYAGCAGWKVSDGGVVVSLSAYCWVLETQTARLLSCVLGFFSPGV